jgi:hypothetical protein
MLPRPGILGLEKIQRKRAAHNTADLSQVLNVTQTLSLYQDIAYCRRLCRTGAHREPGGVGGELVKQSIP